MYLSYLLLGLLREFSESESLFIFKTERKNLSQHLGVSASLEILGVTRRLLFSLTSKRPNYTTYFEEDGYTDRPKYHVALI